jgi:hypothetical protein
MTLVPENAHLLAKIRICNSLVTPISADFFSVDIGRAGNKPLHSMSDAIVNSLNKFLLEFHYTLATSVESRNLIARHADNQDLFITVLSLNSAECKIDECLLEQLRFFIREFAQSVTEGAGGLFIEDYREAELDADQRFFLKDEIAAFINRHADKPVSDPFIWEIPGAETVQVPIQGRFKKAPLQERKNETFTGIAQSDGARGSYHTAHLWRLNDHRQRLTTEAETFLVDYEPFARIASQAHSKSPHIVRIRAHQSIDAKGQARWHLDNVEIAGEEDIGPFELT